MKRLFFTMVLSIAFITANAGFLTRNYGHGEKYYLVEYRIFNLETGLEVIECDPSDQDADYMYVLIDKGYSAMRTDKYGKQFYYEYKGKDETGADLYSMEPDYQPFLNSKMVYYLAVKKDKIFLYSSHGMTGISIYQKVKDD